MTRTEIPNYVAGTWAIDASHSTVGFTVRHMMVSKVRGTFAEFEGTFTTGAELLDSGVTATIDMASINTNNAQRDGHLRTNDFFAIEEFPTMTFRSTGIRAGGKGGHLVDGELTLRGVTKPVVLDTEIDGFGPDAYGGTRAGFTATTEIDRKDFGVEWNGAIDGGGVVVSDTVSITLEIQGVLQP